MEDFEKDLEIVNMNQLEIMQHVANANEMRDFINSYKYNVHTETLNMIYYDMVNAGMHNKSYLKINRNEGIYANRITNDVMDHFHQHNFVQRTIDNYWFITWLSEFNEDEINSEIGNDEEEVVVEKFRLTAEELREYSQEHEGEVYEETLDMIYDYMQNEAKFGKERLSINRNSSQFANRITNKVIQYFKDNNFYVESNGDYLHLSWEYVPEGQERKPFTEKPY